jgi:hypothetical protein
MATPEPQPENNQRLHETPGTSSAPSTQRTRGQTPPSPDVGPARRALEREIQSAASHRRSSSSGTRTLATVSQNTVAQRAPPPKERDAAAVAASYAAVYPEPLSAEQRAARAAQGAQGAQAVADVQAEYRRRVSLYTVKYNVRPAELMRIVQDATRGSNVDYWGRVDGVLREKYGF